MEKVLFKIDPYLEVKMTKRDGGPRSARGMDLELHGPRVSKTSIPGPRPQTPVTADEERQYLKQSVVDVVAILILA